MRGTDMTFADVIVDISARELDRPFQYIVPPELEEEIRVGSQVVVPFGGGNRETNGFVINLSGVPKFDISKTKSIIGIEKRGIAAESHLISLAFWIKENYGSTMNEAIRAVMPVKRLVREKIVKTIYPLVEKNELRECAERFKKKHNTARARLLEHLLTLKDSVYYDGIDYSRAIRNLNLAPSVVSYLEQMGIIGVDAKKRYRRPESEAGSECVRELNGEQARVVEKILSDYKSGVRKTYLLHGVTGSGKTEVYINIIEGVLREGGQAIVLIPEIALTFQTVGRFYARFGDRVCVMHSRLSAGERYDQFLMAKRGEADIMIGPRSALFAPFSRLGLIVVDEEHEASYQSENPPKYHAREVAIQRAGMVGASVVLGSATPSLESYYKASKGEYELFKLEKRAGGAAFPKIDVVDLRKEFEEKNYSIFSRRLSELIKDRLKKREQIMIFINRRGYAGSATCRKCGEAVGCPHCSVPLKPHMRDGLVDVLKCHYCGYEEKMPRVCPSCGSKYIGAFGIGTQQVEQAVRKSFPEASLLRMDADATAGKDGHERILKKFKDGGADILIGTQMIVKGHDFPNVTLVGIIAADLSLNANDYRAAERTYQIIAQAAGRAGRGEKAGEVVLQTYQPRHYSIVCAANQDYEGFYSREMRVRELLQYPPVSNILGVLIFSESEEDAKKLSVRLAQIMKGYGGVDVLGPGDAPIAKTKDIYRKMIYGKCKSREKLRLVKDGIEAFMDSDTQFTDCGVQFEFNVAG